MWGESWASACVDAVKWLSGADDVDGRGVVGFASAVGDGECHSAEFVSAAVQKQFIAQKTQEGQHPLVARLCGGGVIVGEPFKATLEGFPKCLRV